MSLCVSDCFRATPLPYDDCQIVTREGGINRLVFFACNWQFSGVVEINGNPTTIGAITDISAWQTGVQNRLIVRSPLGIGNKPESTFTNERLQSCLPEAIASETHALAFISKAFEDTNEKSCQFWNTIRNNYLLYRIGWIDCTGRLYVGSSTIPGFQFVPTAWSHVIPDNNDTLQSFNTGLSFKNQGLVCPITVPNLNAAFDVTPIS